VGWGLDAHWAAIARDRAWRMGTVDATPIRHGLRRTARGYGHADAVAETRAFLADRPYLSGGKLPETLATYRSWR
jgi:hypothetical protein